MRTRGAGSMKGMYENLESMRTPRPFTAAELILARGAVGWFLNLIVAAMIVGLFFVAAGSAAGTAGSAGAAELSPAGAAFLALTFGYALYRLILRLIEPFRDASALRNGRLLRGTIVDRRARTRVFSRMGAKRRTVYTIRPEGEAAAPVFEVSFGGLNAFPGDTCVLLARPGGGGGSRESYFALECFLHHRGLSFSDLREGLRERRSGALAKAFLTALTLVAAAAAILVLLLR